MFPLLDRRLGELGHGDVVVIADGKFSATADAKRPPIWVPGHSTLEVVEALLTEVEHDPLDGPPAFMIMENPDDEPASEWAPRAAEFRALVNAAGPWRDRAQAQIMQAVMRSDFHLLSKEAELVIATTDPTSYACFALRVAG